MIRLAAALPVLLLASVASADDTTRKLPAKVDDRASSQAAFVSKKDLYLREKAKQFDEVRAKKQRPPIGKPPAKLINLYNTWTDEWIALDAEKPVLTKEMANRFLRCHFTNEPTAMEQRLIGTVVEAAKTFGVDRVNIVSGFRHPKYNLMLRKKGRQVARDSQHTHGNAIDFWLPGISIHKLHSWAVGKKMGGVGLYLGSGFVHMDTGKIRYWNGD